MNAETSVHQPNRLGRKPGVERIEEVLKLGHHFSRLLRSPCGQQVFVYEKLVMLPG